MSLIRYDHPTRHEEYLSDTHQSDHFTWADRERLVEVTVEMKHLKEGLGTLRTLLEDHASGVRVDSKAMEERVRQLEQWKYWIMGAATICGFLAGMAGRRLFGI